MGRKRKTPSESLYIHVDCLQGKRHISCEDLGLQRAINKLISFKLSPFYIIVFCTKKIYKKKTVIFS